MASDAAVKPLKLKIKLKKDGSAELTPPEDRRRENAFSDGRDRKRHRNGAELYKVSETEYGIEEEVPRRTHRTRDESTRDDTPPVAGERCQQEATYSKSLFIFSPLEIADSTILPGLSKLTALPRCFFREEEGSRPLA